jgi:hypothetical protein
MKKPTSPKEFLKQRRPDNFSDSESVDAQILDRSMFEYFLDTLTSRSEEMPFENFARELAKREICPNILPHTGPTGGGDSKVDAETYPVADDLSLAWYTGIGREAATERWAFAISAKAQWRSKVQSDVGKIAKTGRGYTKAFFITSRFVKDKTRAEVEDALSKKHGLDVRILDRNWILDRVFTNRHEQLAIEQLGIQVSTQTEIKKGPHDTEREQALTELESAITSAIQEGRFTLQLVDDCIAAAKFARNMELPRTDVEGRLVRAERLANEHGTNHQKVVAAYEHAATAFWYFEDYDVFIEFYPKVEALAKDTLNAYDLELLGNLWMLLHTAVRQQWLEAKKADLKSKTAFITSELERLSSDTARPSTALQARTLLLDQRLVAATPEKVKAILEELRDVIQQSEGLVGYPLKPYLRMIQELGTFLGDRPAYEALADTIVEIVAKHDGDIAAARLLVKRGAQHLNAARDYDAIRVLGRALTKLFKHESRDDLIRALYLCGLAYEHVGLLWAARGTTLTAAGIAVNDFWTYSEITRLQGTGYSRLKWIELQLGRLPHVLAWHELDLLARATLEGIPEDWEDDEVNFMAVVGILLLRATIPQLQLLTTLPDVLDGLRLHLGAVALRYALGHNDTLPEELVGDDPDAFFQKWIEQPAAASLPEQPQLYDGTTAILTSNLAGCRVTLETDNATPCVDIAESILAALESLLSTALAERAIAREPHLSIRVVLRESAEQLIAFETTDQEGRPHVEVRCKSFHPHKIAPDDQHQVKATISDILMHVLARVFLIENIEETLTKLFRDEQAIDRAINFTSSLVVAGNILGDHPKTMLAAWKGTNEFPLTRDTVWSATIPSKPATEKSAPKYGKGEPPTELQDWERLKHGDVETQSLIRIALWDRAKWNGTGSAVGKPNEPPILALAFENREAALEIFKGLEQDLGHIDAKERLRISILRGVDKQEPLAYTVVVGSNITDENLSPDKLVIMVSRINTMYPASDENLSRFLKAYARIGAYFLMPALMRNGDMELLFGHSIGKRELQIREAWQVGRHDPDAAGIREDDDPIIPAGEENPPVKELLESRKEMKR